MDYHGHAVAAAAAVYVVAGHMTVFHAMHAYTNSLSTASELAVGWRKGMGT
jgi:hypothetical protein